MEYIGDELDLFKNAVNWKKYWSEQITPYISGRVLEVGAGIGGNIEYLHSGVSSYTALEPDKSLVSQLEEKLEKNNSESFDILSGTLGDIGKDVIFDTIIYIDVMEHIEDDKSEFTEAVSHLSAGGHLIVLCPAHQFLYSPFDSAVGHFRRHNKRSMRGLANNDQCVVEKKMIFLDSMGLFASVANKWFLKESLPSRKQVNFWDSFIVPCSVITDRLCLKNVGKTIVGVWQKV